MALQTSGAISLNDIHQEAGGSNGTQCSLNDTDIRDLIGKSSGAQNSFNEYYGASAGQPFTLTIGSNAKRYVVYSQAFAAGWDGNGLLTVNISSGVYVWSDDPDDYALIISGSYPNGIRVNNYGYIMGRGGDDPNLSKYNVGALAYDYQNKHGGDAIYISASGVTIDNKSTGYILGGGGAGSWATTNSVINTASTSGGGGAGGGAGGNYPFTGISMGGAVGQNGDGPTTSFNTWPSANVYYAPTTAGGGGAGGHYIKNPNNSNYDMVSGAMGGGRKVPTGDTGGRSGRITINSVVYESGQGGAAGVNGGFGNIATNNYTQFSGGGGGGYGARGGEGWQYAINNFLYDYGNAGKAINKTTSYTLTGSTSRIYGST